MASIALFVTCAAVAGAGAEGWLLPRFDRGRTAHTPSVSAITQPRLSWTIDLSGREYLIAASPADGAGACALDPSAPLRSCRVWEIL